MAAKWRRSSPGQGYVDGGRGEALGKAGAARGHAAFRIGGEVLAAHPLPVSLRLHAFQSLHLLVPPAPAPRHPLQRMVPPPTPAHAAAAAAPRQAVVAVRPVRLSCG